LQYRHLPNAVTTEMGGKEGHLFCEGSWNRRISAADEPALKSADPPG
jgi:hypothetical protein